MKQKELLLWVVAIAALALSLIAVIGPKGLKSDAAMRPYTMQVESANPTVSGFPSSEVECIEIANRTLTQCMKETSTPEGVNQCVADHAISKNRCHSLFWPTQNDQ